MPPFFMDFEMMMKTDIECHLKKIVFIKTMKPKISEKFEQTVFMKPMKTKIDEKIEQNGIHEADEDEN
ncbi:hypothetical protein [Lysinibacillus endophyticus]|uniref:hypothetical protein n=1 Tax=Ureibacillus endophyticus TaxID=1978490 RepID=UPI003134686D